MNVIRINEKKEVRFDDFRVIARQLRPGCWEPTEDCPFADHHDPLRMVRQAVEDNLMIMACGLPVLGDWPDGSSHVRQMCANSQKCLTQDKTKSKVSD